MGGLSAKVERSSHVERIAHASDGAQEMLSELQRTLRTRSGAMKGAANIAAPSESGGWKGMDASG